MVSSAQSDRLRTSYSTSLLPIPSIRSRLDLEKVIDDVAKPKKMNGEWGRREIKLPQAGHLQLQHLLPPLAEGSKKRGLLNVARWSICFQNCYLPVVAAFTKHKVLNERALKPSDEISLRDLYQDHQHRSAVDGADGELFHPAGGPGADRRKEVGQSVGAVKAGGVPTKQEVAARDAGET